MHSSVLSDVPIARLDISFLGAFQLKVNGEDVSGKLKYRKAIYLLAYLSVANGRWVAREQLADLLWPDLRGTAALTNLRQVLSNLSKLINGAVGAQIIQSRRDSIAFFSDERVNVDIALLLNDWQADDEHVAFCDWLVKSFEPRLTQLNLDFLERLELNVGIELHAWIAQTRKYLKTRWRDLASRLCLEQEKSGRVASAVAIANQLWEQDSLNETTAAHLIRLLLAYGDLKRASFVLYALEQNLLSAFGTRASAATRNLLQQNPISTVAEVVGNRDLIEQLVPSALPEIRWLTIVYVEFDLSQSAGGTDTEMLLQLEQSLSYAQEKIKLWGGRCNAVVGQGFHASFGMHTEPEQDALRSIYAAQEIMLSDESQQHLRIGICAGKVQCSLDDIRFLGPLPRLSQELCWAADAGGLVFDDVVAIQIRDRLAIDAVPVQAHERYACGIDKYTLTRKVSAIYSQQELPLIGRTEEMQALMAYWEQASRGQPQWLVLRGNAGIGKTRLASELARRLDTAGNRVIRIYCTLEYQHQSLAPLRLALAELFGLTSIRVNEFSEKIREQLQQLIPGYEPEEETLHAFLSLFDQSMLAEVDNKNQIFAALGTLFDQLSKKNTCMILIDDFHWSDFTTREFLARYAACLEHQRLLLLVTTRPDSPLEYAGASPVVTDLFPLTLDAAEQLVAACDQAHLLSAQDYARIALDCGGIPLFIERLTLSLAENGQHYLVPVKELLQSELDKLGPYKKVLQLAAVIGNNFNARILHEIVPDADVDGPLQLAISYRLIQVSKKPGYYHFVHALIADAAYQSCPEIQRRLVHQQVAGQLLKDTDISSAEIARHFEAAHHWKEAVDWWTVSGQKALANEFAMDALHHFSKALEIVLKQQSGLEHLQTSLRLSVGGAALLCQGYGSELGHQQFRAVCDSLNGLSAPSEAETEALFRALSGLYMGGSSQGKSDGLGIARRLEELADTPAKSLMACFALGNSLFWRGLFVEALNYQQEGLAIARELNLEERQRYWAEDLEILIRAFLCWNLWFLNDDSAYALALESTLLARERKKSHALCFMLTFNTAMCWTAGQIDEVSILAGEGVQLGTQYGFPLWQSMNSLFYLSAQASGGKLKDFTPALQAADNLHNAYRAGTTTASWVLASTLIKLHCWDEARYLLNKTLSEIDKYEDYYCHADLLRLSSLCHMQDGNPELARETLDHALEMATAQGAQGLLRAISQTMTVLQLQQQKHILLPATTQS
ncbi:AAA family ATPase [Undibacterium pigrum]|uniref:AAA ATPase-like protein n=1 Tax=Undibacterium pigrum TaxID=401470 RepID=A0A318IZS0_9BURK|nr:AAA family ATPase [Undibacterium pigrum]PXX39891.1 AAA ATPase-like protein [Undibacterium pigrum]